MMPEMPNFSGKQGARLEGLELPTRCLEGKCPALVRHFVPDERESASITGQTQATWTRTSDGARFYDFKSYMGKN
jgi:hypothetical protein